MCTSYNCSTIPSVPDTACLTQTSPCPAFPVSISEALNQLTENAWHKDEGWMQVIWTQHWIPSEHSGAGHRLPCRGSGQGNEEMQDKSSSTWLRVHPTTGPFSHRCASLTARALLLKYTGTLGLVFPAALGFSHLLSGPGTPSLGPWGRGYLLCCFMDTWSGGGWKYKCIFLHSVQ